MTQAEIKTSNQLDNPYDLVPYTSYCYSQTNPLLLQVIGELFGLKTTDAKKARILEIGCASGNNIAAIATILPESTCHGIDFSEKQIEQGKKLCQELNIKNLTLEHKSIEDFIKKDGKFDYIIVHGVFSWVNPQLQKKIIKICKENLSENGIAYVSYNTMPGWASVKAMREMMIYHTKRFTEPQQKSEQAKLLLKFIKDSLKDYNKNAYAEIIENELNILSTQGDYYLLHDHLEENNIQYYFHEFIEMASSEGLQYLADTNLPSMFSGNLPKESAEVLATLNDIVRSEQYMDFIFNRRFRSTLLCHSDKTLRRNLNPNDIKEKFFSNQFILPENIKEYKLGSEESLHFRTNTNMSLTSSDAIIISAITILENNKRKPLHLSKLSKLVKEQIKNLAFYKKATEEEISNLLASSFLRYIFMGGIAIHICDGEFTNKVSNKPIAGTMIRYQSSRQDWVSNLRAEVTKINQFDNALLPLLDGTNDKESLINKLMPYFESGQLVIKEQERKISDIDEIKAKLSDNLDKILETYASLGLLIA